MGQQVRDVWLIVDIAMRFSLKIRKQGYGREEVIRIDMPHI